MAETLGELGSDRAWLVHGADGTDEISIAGETYVAELNDGKVHEFSRAPRGRRPRAPSARAPCSAARPATTPAALRGLLAGEPSAYRDAVLLNAAAALLVAERAGDLARGRRRWRAESIDSGAARAHRRPARRRHRRRAEPAR